MISHTVPQMKNVLFLCPEYPYPANSGGKVAHVNHINGLKKVSNKLNLVFFDIEWAFEKEVITDDEAIFIRTVLKANSVYGKIQYLWSAFFTKWPRIFHFRKNDNALNYVETKLDSGTIDVAFFDHLSSFAFLRGTKKRKNIKYVYQAHNLEQTIAKQQYQITKSLFLRLLHYIEYKKIVYFEKKFIALSDLVVTISSFDYDVISKKFNPKAIVNIPELLPLQDKLWQYNGSKNLVFIGTTNYFPNYDAVEWLVNTLMPHLLSADPDIKCIIIGDSKAFAGKEIISTESVLYKGRVSDEEVTNLFFESSLFISPVIYGSGIKVKILEASSLAMPILSTPQSLKGNEFLDSAMFGFDRDDIPGTVKKIINILNNKDIQLTMSEQIKQSLTKEFEKSAGIWQIVTE